MPRLIFLDPPTPMPEVPLSNREITIGRSRHSDLCLDDESVSRHHARIRPTDDGYMIEDAGSLHHTAVNGQFVTVHRLSANDLVQIGKYKLRFVDGSDAAATQQIMTSQNPTDHLRLLLSVTQLISSSVATDEVLKHVIDGVIQITRAQRGFLMMVNASGQLEVRVARNFDHTALDTAGLAASTSVINRVHETGTAIVLSNTMDTAATSSIVALGLRSVMCVPLKSQDRLLGLIYVDSLRQAEGFTAADLELFESLASQAAVAIEKSQLYEELQRYNSSLEEQVRTRTAELVQAERMAAVGRLAAGIAHEINSPLGVITSNMDILCHLIETPADQPGNLEIAKEVVATCATANARLRRIMKAFQSLTGLDQAEMKSVDLNGILEEVLTLTETKTSDRILITKELQTLQRVMCSPGRIGQVFMNLLLNAIQSIDGKGSIYIRSEQLDGRVRVTIRDTGRGMTPAQVDRAFDSSFNRKEGRVSASLGLMITSQILREHQGDIRIESNPGSGTSVFVSVPNNYRQSIFASTLG